VAVLVELLGNMDRQDKILYFRLSFQSVAVLA
jgi:hypothetical protein